MDKVSLLAVSRKNGGRSIKVENINVIDLVNTIFQYGISADTNWRYQLSNYHSEFFLSKQIFNFSEIRIDFFRTNFYSTSSRCASKG